MSGAILLLAGVYIMYFSVTASIATIMGRSIVLMVGVLLVIIGFGKLNEKEKE